MPNRGFGGPHINEFDVGNFTITPTLGDGVWPNPIITHNPSEFSYQSGKTGPGLDIFRTLEQSQVPGVGGIPEDPWFPPFWETYDNTLWRGVRQGQPSQHQGLPPIRSFPTYRSPEVEQFYQNPPFLPGDLSMGDWETWVDHWNPQAVEEIFKENMNFLDELINGMKLLQ